MGRHAGQIEGNPPRSTQTISAGTGTALLTPPQGMSPLRGMRPTPVYGLQLGRRPVPHDLPVIGSPEHTALLSGSMDLSEIIDEKRSPLVGFAPIVLDPAGPGRADDAPSRDGSPSGGGGQASLPSRRTMRGTARPGLPAPRPSARSGNPASRAAARSRTLPAPPVVAGPPTGALFIDEVSDTLASIPAVASDPTPTGELARPFVNETSLADWVTLDDVPPPVSVDVFQRAVRARMSPEAAAALPALDEDRSARGRASRSRTRKEQRARERALDSIRGVTARRIAKGGVLVITALGVVSSASPQTLGALGLDHDSAGSQAQGGLGFASALAPKITVPELSPEGAALRQQLQRERLLQQEIAAEQVDAAVHASTSAGSAVLDLAFQQDAAMEARHRAELARAAREAARNPRGYAAKLVADKGWSQAQFQCLDRLWTRESQWNYRAVNRSSGAYGIAQALPGNKMNSFGSDWRSNPITQIKWGLNYIEDRYTTPCGAWAHSEATGWY